MTDEKLISVIIPVYKVEKYLDDCVQSVIKQYNEKIEIILVDDGSPDCCGEMCDEYEKKYERIKVIHKKNGGLSSARNEGMKIAKGKYIMFLDSDDMMHGKALEIIQEDLKSELELYTYIIEKINEDGTLIDEKGPFFESGIIKSNIFMKKYYAKNNGLPWAAWQSVYKRDTIEKNNILFPLGKNAEDVDFYIQYLKAIKGNDIMYSNEYIVKYRANRQGSIMTELKPKTMENILQVYEKYANDEDIEISEIFSNIYVSGLNYIVKSKDKELLNLMLPNINLDIVKKANRKKSKDFKSCDKNIRAKKNFTDFAGDVIDWRNCK